MTALRRAGGLVVLLLVSSAAPVAAQQHAHPAPVAAIPRDSARVPLYDNLGRHHYAVTTSVPLAQRYFDQGLRLTWGFNHAEAIRAFEEGERLDSACAMCAWGTAYALGPNINAGMDSAAGVRARRAVERAKVAARGATPRERALIEALAARYAPVPPADRAALDSAFAARMAEVASRFADDAETQVIHADALMNLSPWNYWTADGGARPATPLILQRLEGVLAANADHPGACHLFIHAVEAKHPRRALPCAERLAALMPGAGHVVHMPGHIYVRVGRYADAIAANLHALHSDGELMEGRGVARRGTYPNGYHPHNWHFLAFAATMAGNSRTAIDAARKTVERLDPVVVPWVEPVLPLVPLTLSTFGRWREVLAEPLPTNAPASQVALTWYARGVAHAALGRTGEAASALREARRAAARVPAGETAIAARVAVRALEGEIALRGGDPRSAVRHFTDAVAVEDSLAYNEPPTWYYPVRQSLGQALLAAGRPAEAERVYREDLELFPENGWSLFGLARALDAQRKEGEASEVRQRFAKAWKGADVKLTGSRF